MKSLIRCKSFLSDWLLIGFAIISFLTAGLISQNTPMPGINISMQERAVNINKDLLIFLSAGNRRLITDLLWIQTLIEGDIEHYSGKDLNSWMYIRFNTISELDPHFYENYAWGGQYLSIVKDDLQGAVSIMEKGVKFFPDDYRINFNLGFTYYFELGQYEHGLKYLEKIQNHPQAPPFIRSTIFKIKSELGFNHNDILALIYDQMTSTKDEALRKKLSADYHALKSQRDITCLNEGGTDCETLDSYGDKYIFLYGKWHTRTPFTPYRLKRKGDHKMTPSATTI